MYFDLKPKENAEDLFDYREELQILNRYIKDKLTRMIVIKGPRRVGKTSIIKTCLKENKIKNIFIDARLLSAPTRKEFDLALINGLKGMSIFSELIDKIEEVELGVKISLSKETNLIKLIENKEFVLVVDEAQYLIGSGVDLLLAYLYDHTKIKIILSGSQIGLLDRFIGQKISSAALFGRPFAEIKLQRFNREKSLQFLKEGFKQVQKKIDEKNLEEAVNMLDGSIGWLTAYGYYSLNYQHKTAIEKTKEYGLALVKKEYEEFLSPRRISEKFYNSIMQNLLLKEMKWSQLKRALEISSGVSLTDMQFNRYLKNLLDYGFIEEKEGQYFIPDPLIIALFTNMG